MNFSDRRDTLKVSDGASHSQRCVKCITPALSPKSAPCPGSLRRLLAHSGKHALLQHLEPRGTLRGRRADGGSVAQVSDCGRALLLLEVSPRLRHPPWHSFALHFADVAIERLDCIGLVTRHDSNQNSVQRLASEQRVSSFGQTLQGCNAVGVGAMLPWASLQQLVWLAGGPATAMQTCNRDILSFF